MNYPLLSEYIEAIKAAEENFAQLKHLRPVLEEDGQPVMSSGNFAVVFKMKDEQTGKLHAVKCFLKEQEGRAEAYRLIAEELEYVSSTFLTPIKYLNKELFVDTGQTTETEFPVLLMDWVEGQTLDKYIREHIDDQYELSLLVYQFSRLAMWLMPQPFAHGDLKPDNILVRKDGTLALVDYDGMYVPTMKGQKARELGCPDFRHPGRTEDVFDEHIDDFSLVSILLSLKAIALQPELLEQYGASDRLLFSANDYRNLYESQVMDAIKALMTDTELATLYSLFILSVSQNNLSLVSFRLFNLNRPEINTNINIAYLKKRAIQGDINSQFKLGVCYIDGDGVEKNYEEAIKWLNKAASSNHAKALRRLADCYIEGEGVKEDVEKGLSLLRQAELYYDKEDVCAVIEYKIIALKKLDRYNEIIPLLKEYSQPGKGCRKCSLLKTYNQLERCCPWMQFELSFCYYQGRGITKNYDQAIECLIQAAEQGYEKAEQTMDLFYNLYKDEENIDYNKFIEWYTKSANRGNKSSQIKLFELYVRKQDYQNAIMWLEKAAEQDDIDVKYLYFIGLYYEENKDYQESIKWYKKAADKDDAKSQYKLALFYGLGKGVREDINISKGWLKKAAEQGYDDAIKLLTEDDEESLSTEVAEDDLENAWTDEYGVKYSADRKRLLMVPHVIKDFSKRLPTILDEYSIKEGTEIICDNAFERCAGLKHITIPHGVTVIGKYAFYCCQGIESLTLPDGLIRIEQGAFYECIRLISVVFPKSMKKIGPCAFENCTNIETVTIPDSVVDIGNYSFQNCTHLQYIVLSSNITCIGDAVFASCYNLTELSIPYGVKNIGANAFLSCRRLEKIWIPDTVSTIDHSAFIDCKKLAYIFIPAYTFNRFEELLPEYREMLNEQVTIEKHEGLKRVFSAKELEIVNYAKVVQGTLSLMVCFYMNDGCQRYIPLCKDSKLSIGDEVDLKKTKLIEFTDEGIYYGLDVDGEYYSKFLVDS